MLTSLKIYLLKMKKKKDDESHLPHFQAIIKNHFQMNLLFIHLNIRIEAIKFHLERHWHHVVFKNWNCNLRDLIFL